MDGDNQACSCWQLVDSFCSQRRSRLRAWRCGLQDKIIRRAATVEPMPVTNVTILADSVADASRFKLRTFPFFGSADLAPTDLTRVAAIRVARWWEDSCKVCALESREPFESRSHFSWTRSRSFCECAAFAVEGRFFRPPMTLSMR